MSKQAVVALRAERGEVLALAGGLTPEEWAMPSDCRGWSVRDVVAHMGSLFHLLLDPGAAWKAMRAERVESLNDELVDVRRSWSTGQVLDEYETWSRRTLRLLGVVQVPPLGAIRLPLGDLGTYPAHLLANSLVFDHYAHLRLDLLAPFGPLDRPVPPSDALRLGPTLEWLLGGIPQQCRDALAWVDRPLNLRLRGPAGNVWRVLPGGPGGLLVVEPGEAFDAAATVASTTTELVVWATKRRDWRTRDVEITGDEPFAARFLDDLNLV